MSTIVQLLSAMNAMADLPCGRQGFVGRAYRGVLLFWVLACGPSCQDVDEHEFQYSVEIGDKVSVSSDSRLCEGDILRIERTIVHVEDVLGVTVEEPIQMFLYDSGLTQCISGASGCIVDGEVHTLWQSIDHELVHAVADSLGQPSSFWAEGLAVALSGRTQRGETEVLVNVDLTPGDLDYNTAGHFVRWLAEEYGEQGVREIAQGKSLIESYGIDLADAVADYEAEAPWSYPHWDPCAGDVLAATGMDQWQTAIVADCMEPDGTVESSIGTGILRMIDVQNAGMYHLMLRGGLNLKMVYCQMDVLDVMPAEEFAGDIIREDAGLKPPSRFPSGVEHQVRLEVGMHRLQFSTEEDDGEVFELELVRL